MKSAPSGSQQRTLLTTRARIIVAAALTSLVFVQGIRQLLRPSLVESEWMPQLDFGLHGDFGLRGWPVAKIAFYLALCVMAFALIRGTKRWERVFFTGWLVDLVSSPLRTLGPMWALTSRLIGLVGTAIALFVALSFLLPTRNAQTG